MRKLIFTSAVLLLGATSSVHAETYTITGGNWDFQASWNTNATGDPNSLVYDNGETGAAALLSGSAGIVNWAPAIPTYTGTYSGTIETDAMNNVVGGSLVVSGVVGYQVVTGDAPTQNSWWAHSYTDLTLNFATMTASTSAYQCHETPIAVAPCSGGGASPETTQFALIAGAEGIGGTARPAATFDGTTLTVFAEGYSAPGPGTDYLNSFTLTSSAGGGGPDVAFDDVTEAGDILGVGSVAVLVSGQAAQVEILNALTGLTLNQHTFFDTAANPWTGIAIDTVSDGNSDGTADDPAIAMLAQNDVTGQIVVQTRLVSNNNKVGTHIPFFNNSDWSPIDVAVVNDINGDGTTGDTGIAVLAENTVDGRFQVQMKLLSNESLAFKERFLNPTFEAGSIEAFVPAGGGDSTITVMGLRSDGSTIAQSRQVSNGAALPNIYGFGAGITPGDLTVTADGNGDGNANDPALIFYGKRVSNDNLITRTRSAATGAQIATRTMVSTPEANEGRITTITSANGNGIIDVSATSRAVSDDSLTLRTRDGLTNWIVNDIPL